MNAVNVRRLCTTFALLAVVAVVFMTSMRADRFWNVSPTWPYTDPAWGHWFYRSLSALESKGKRMGIWGWAAQAWVYSGTIPATRESSTEFAWKDWGEDGYYRKRYMASLTAAPPEYFLVAVGPTHLMFTDRATHGTASMPDLDAFLRRHYVAALDDGDAALLIRRDVYRQCCIAPLEAGAPDETPAASTAAFVPTVDGWKRAAPGPTPTEVRLHASSPRRARAIVIPFRVQPAQDGSRQALRIGLRMPDGSVTGCEGALAAAVPGTIAMCVIDQPAGHDWTLVADSSGASADAWIEAGRPLVMLEAK